MTRFRGWLRVRYCKIMDQTAVNSTVHMMGAQAATAVHDLSLWSLFLQADVVVKTVMLLLLGASIWCWSIIFEKTMRLRRLRREVEQLEETLWSGGSLEDRYDRVGTNPAHTMAALFASRLTE